MVKSVLSLRIKYTIYFVTTSEQMSSKVSLGNMYYQTNCKSIVSRFTTNTAKHYNKHVTWMSCFIPNLKLFNSVKAEIRGNASKLA